MLALAAALALATAPSEEALLKAGADDFLIDGMNRFELLKLRFKVQEAQPGIISPTVQLSSGAVIAFLGLGGFAWAGTGVSQDKGPWVRLDPVSQQSVLTGTTWAALITSSVFVVFGAALVACGAIRFSRYLPQRRLAAYKMQVIDTVLEDLAPPSPMPAPP